MRSFLVYVWRDSYHVAVLSVTDEQFLAALKKWASGQKVYRLEIVERLRIHD